MSFFWNDLTLVEVTSTSGTGLESLKLYLGFFCNSFISLSMSMSVNSVSLCLCSYSYEKVNFLKPRCPFIRSMAKSSIFSFIRLNFFHCLLYLYFLKAYRRHNTMSTTTKIMFIPVIVIRFGV